MSIQQTFSLRTYFSVHFCPSSCPSLPPLSSLLSLPSGSFPFPFYLSPSIQKILEKTHVTTEKNQTQTMKLTTVTLNNNNTMAIYNYYFLLSISNLDMHTLLTTTLKAKTDASICTCWWCESLTMGVSNGTVHALHHGAVYLTPDTDVSIYHLFFSAKDMFPSNIALIVNHCITLIHIWYK